MENCVQEALSRKEAVLIALFIGLSFGFGWHFFVTFVTTEGAKRRFLCKWAFICIGFILSMPLLKTLLPGVSEYLIYLYIGVLPAIVRSFIQSYKNNYSYNNGE